MSRFSWIIAQGLTGRSIEGELGKSLSAYETKLLKSADNVKLHCNEADRLRNEIQDSADLPFPILDTDRVVSEARLVYSEICEKYRQAKRLIEVFQSYHGLVREPQLPNLLLGLLLLGCMVGAEALINSLFMQNAHMTATPVAALIVCALISLANILVSSCAGYLYRWSGYGLNALDKDSVEFRAKRLMGRVSFLFYLAAISFLQLTVGLVRSQESLTQVSHSPEKYWEMLITPEAVFLVLTGACLSILAFRKAQGVFGDPYPGYDTYQRAIDDTRDEMLDARDRYSEQVNEQADEALEQIDKMVKSNKKSIAAYNRAVDACSKAFGRYQNELEKAKSLYRADIAQLSQTHNSGTGKEQSDFSHINNGELFESHILDIDLPEHINLPEGTKLKSDVQAQKSKALEALSEIFDKHVN